MKNIVQKGLDFYHGLPSSVRSALAFAVGAGYEVISQAWNLYKASEAAHQSISFDWHQVAINAAVAGSTTFIAHVVPFKALTTQNKEVK